MNGKVKMVGRLKKIRMDERKEGRKEGRKEEKKERRNKGKKDRWNGT